MSDKEKEEYKWKPGDCENCGHPTSKHPEEGKFYKNCDDPICFWACAGR